MSVRDDMQRAQDLIREKRYAEARMLLQTIDHPKAREWLARLDEIDPPGQAARPAARAADRTNQLASPPARPAAMPLDYGSPVQTSVRRSRVPFFGLILLLLFTVVGGVGVGLLLWLSSKLIYLIFLSIVIAAALLFGVLTISVRVGKVRSGLVLFVFGVIAGLLLYGTYRGAEYLGILNDEYQAFRTLVAEEITAEDSNATQEEVDALIDEVLLQETGAAGFDGFRILYDDYLEDEVGDRGFIGFIKLDLQDGLTIQRTSSTSFGATSGTGGMNLPDWAEAVYWALEIAIVTLGPAVALVNRGKEPFCEAENRWLAWEFAGRVEFQQQGMFVNLIKQGQFSAAGQLMTQQRGRNLLVTVYTARCSERSPDAHLKATVQRGRSVSELLKMQISAAAHSDLLSNVRM